MRIIQNSYYYCSISKELWAFFMENRSRLVCTGPIPLHFHEAVNHFYYFKFDRIILLWYYSLTLLLLIPIRFSVLLLLVSLQCIALISLTYKGRRTKYCFPRIAISSAIARLDLLIFPISLQLSLHFLYFLS